MEDLTMPNNGGARTFSDHAEKTEFELIEPGEYEVTFTCEQKHYGQEMRPGLQCKFQIRKDVEQPFAGRCIFETFWLDKDGSGWYDTRKIHKVLLTQDPDKRKLSFESQDECLLYINGLNMRITVEKVFDDYSGKYKNQVKFLSYAPSKANVAPSVENTVEETSAPHIEDNDLPF